MIELEMMRRMIRRGLLLAPVVLAALLILGGVDYMVSGAIGIAITLFNLWLAGRLIGGLAENRPELMMVGAMAALLLNLVVVVIAGVTLKRVDYLDFPTLGVTLISLHLVVVTWEAADKFLKLPEQSAEKTVVKSAGTRS